ncbi:hypothetical protein LWE61_14900 [Sphingobium sufflavum]|uniref:hypothetical protein n=1 Tax=Sphingobium sufflavum TaxID=1129547 RepID=UPI001F425177|nr:hypothetical protein [Sphingobium sufflavum]MCE7797838.1 hypothetical protein [Sphingobium sufflavum]
MNDQRAIVELPQHRSAKQRADMMGVAALCSVAHGGIQSRGGREVKRNAKRPRLLPHGSLLAQHVIGSFNGPQRHHHTPQVKEPVPAIASLGQTAAAVAIDEAVIRAFGSQQLMQINGRDTAAVRACRLHHASLTDHRAYRGSACPNEPL